MAITSLPFNSTSSLFLSRTAIPSLSPSGSVPMIISALCLYPSLSAIAKASVSSGFGDVTVGKSPSGTLCSSTINTLLNPAFCKTSGIKVIDVPCNEVKTIFSLFFISLLSDNLAV